MMYLSKGIIYKGKSKDGLYIRHFGQPMVLSSEEAAMWQKGRFGFAYTVTKTEMNIVQSLVKKSIAICEHGYSEIDKYHALCRCAICANPNFIFGIKPFSVPAKRILTWLRKGGTNLSLPELVCLEDKGIEPEQTLLYEENSTRLLKLIYPWYESIAGELESKMKHSIARKRTVDAVLELLRRKRVVIM